AVEMACLCKLLGVRARCLSRDDGCIVAEIELLEYDRRALARSRKLAQQAAADLVVCGVVMNFAQQPEAHIREPVHQLVFVDEAAGTNIDDAGLGHGRWWRRESAARDEAESHEA